MDKPDLEKLIKDVADYYKQDIGEHFAKAVNRLVSDFPWENQKKELLIIIAQIIDLKISMKN